MARHLLITVILVCAALASCTSMLVGGAGGSAGRPIGAESRSATTIAADNRISATIRSRYRADDDLRRAALSVETRSGRVTLKGALVSFDLRARAVRLARDVGGVAHVANQITIREAAP